MTVPKKTGMPEVEVGDLVEIRYTLGNPSFLAKTAVVGLVVDVCRWTPDYLAVGKYRENVVCLVNGKETHYSPRHHTFTVLTANENSHC